MSSSGQHRRFKPSTAKKIATIGALMVSGVAASAGAASAAEQPAMPQPQPVSMPDPLSALMGMGQTASPLGHLPQAPMAAQAQAPQAPTQSATGGSPMINVPVNVELAKNVANDLDLIQNVHDVFVDVPFLMGTSGDKMNDGSQTGGKASASAADGKGEKGEKGDKGDKGAKGAKGDKGEQGPKGDKGDPGKDATQSGGDQGDQGDGDDPWSGDDGGDEQHFPEPIHSDLLPGGVGNILGG